MKKKDELFALISSMNTSEKGYFKKFSRLHGDTPENKYLRLFDCIAAMKEYDSELVKKEFKGEKLLNQLPAAKHYLNESILNALANYHKDGTVTSQLNHISMLAEIALLKGQYTRCKTLIEKGKRIAQINQAHPMFLSFALAEINLDVNVGTDDIEIEKKYEEMQLVSKKFALQCMAFSIGHKVGLILKDCQFHLSKEQREKIKALIQSLDENEIRQFGTFGARMKYLETRRNYEFFVTKDREEAIRLGADIIELFDENPEQKNISPWNYLATTISLVELYILQGTYDKALSSTEKLNDLLELYRKRTGETHYALLHDGFIEMRLRALLYSKKYKDAIEHLALYEKKYLETHARTGNPGVNAFKFHVASARLFAKQPEVAVDILQQMLQDFEKNSDLRVQYLSRMLEILAQYQVGNKVLLHSMLGSLQRWRKAYYPAAGSAFNIFTGMVRALGTAGSKGETEAALKLYHKKFLHYFGQHSKDSPLLEEFLDINAWIEMQLKRA